ncbi:MAG: GlsB/YeaQ/YmgE family stress response membrane protein [Prevotella sp.]|nr:GlsB/YeaQ/YmgE family stress response membrane protein [Prevotella sp.]
MESYGLIGSIIIGGIAGLLAGKLIKGEGYGCFINVLLGLFGSALCSWLFGLLHIPEWGGLLGHIGTGTIGAVIIVYVASLLRKGK